ncbi:MAG: hypothetical protein QOH75_499 [Actinomycetota bacterium]|jgi:hypothetical protein|nr:hypothetical protein [Actinomycetota bacterium]
MARGISTAGDVVRTTVDGVSVSQLWTEFSDTLRLRNEARDNFLAYLGFKTTATGDQIAQTSDVDDMERASEYGLPKALRAPGVFLTLGFNFDWFDAASRYTWKFLVDADASQVEAVHQAVLEADNRLVFKAMMGALFNNVSRLNPEGLVVQPLYNNDGTVPPEYGGLVHAGTHSHYVTSGAGTMDGNDIIDVTRHVTHHGKGDVSQGERVIVFMHPNEAEIARGIVRGANSAADFIPSESAPAFLTDQTIVGDRPPSALGRIPIFGSLGVAWLSESPLVPAGYLAAVSVAGSNDPRNVLAVREHVRPELRGLRQVPGSSSEYPLQDSTYSRGFGTGVRQRGGAAIMQITASASYAVPALYQTVIA